MKAKNGDERGAPSPPKKRSTEAGRGKSAARGQARLLRIIGGRHRGRRLRFPAGVEIRPTPDRVRETLFNWLQSRSSGAHVLDLFAGSGALGLEALSRGAAHVTFVERDRRSAAGIRAILEEWHEAGATVVCDDALAWLKSGAPVEQPFDLVFMDPPFDSSLIAVAADALARSGRVAADARIYVERRARDAAVEVPAAWRELRQGRAGEVGYHLFAT